MKRVFDFIWPVIGILAVIGSVWMLSYEFRGDSVGPEVWANLKAISPHQYALALASTLLAYAALAGYDRIALLHLGINHISWTFISLCSFTTYALGHNIGASVFSGAMVRYRAYSTKGLSAAQVAVLVGFCSLTFGLGTLLLGGMVLVIKPEQLQRLDGVLPAIMTNPLTSRALGLACLLAVILYGLGSVLRLRPLVIGGLRIDYPHPKIMLMQFVVAPMELLGAAGIIYFALPEAGNPGYFVVLGVFLASFSAALVSNAPGGLGVFELVFIKALPAVPQFKILAALLVFRLFYLLIPLLFAIVVVVLFERSKLDLTLHRNAADADAPKASAGQSRAR
jgi:uncharacterized membrane protein YbhN (UPF0104 family)